ncbi:MAG TPA: DUF3099 domain-containing protein [Mycobacteriales bacterium]
MDVPRRLRRPPVPDVRTLTERERREADIERRRRRYLMIMIPYLTLVVLGFFVLPWHAAKIAVLLVALVLPPLGAIVANAGRRD